MTVLGGCVDKCLSFLEKKRVLLACAIAIINCLAGGLAKKASPVKPLYCAKSVLHTRTGH